MNENKHIQSSSSSEDDLDELDELALIEAAASQFGSNKKKNDGSNSGSGRSSLPPRGKLSATSATTTNSNYNNDSNVQINSSEGYGHRVGVGTVGVDYHNYHTNSSASYLQPRELQRRYSRRRNSRRESATSSTSSHTTVLRCNATGNGTFVPTSNNYIGNDNTTIEFSHRFGPLPMRNEFSKNNYNCDFSAVRQPLFNNMTPTTYNFHPGDMMVYSEDGNSTQAQQNILMRNRRIRRHSRQQQFGYHSHFNLQQPHQQFRNNNYSPTQDGKDDDFEIEEFTEMLPREYQRINNNNHDLGYQNRGSVPGRGSFTGSRPLPMFQNNDNRASTLSIDSSLMPGTMSGVISRKRRSHTDIADAAAEVAAMFGDLSDSEDNFSLYHDEDDCSKNSVNTRGSASATKSTCTTRRSSGASTTGFARLSLHQTSIDERPRKRRSSSSSVSRLDESIRMSARGSFTALNAATAAVAADEATKRLSEVTYPVNEKMDDDYVSPLHKISQRKFQRRAAFVVSSIETEAADALANRTQLLMKDRYETRRAKRPQARRSMSYSSGAKMTSNIIASCLPEDTESIMENPDITTDFMKLTRSRMERRVLSLPDQNAVARLSQTSINEDVDFSSDTSHNPSALSVNLEASAAALRQSYNDRYGHHLSQFHDPPFSSSWSGNRHSNQYNTSIDTSPFGLPHSIANIPHHHLHNQIITPTSRTQIQQQGDLSVLSPSLQVAAEVFNTNALAAQSLAQTAQVAITMLQQAQQTQQKNSEDSKDTQGTDILNRSGEIDYESFNGKVNHVDAVAPDTPEEVRISELIHEAAQLDDVQATKTIISNFKETTRMLSADSDEGNVALHVGEYFYMHE